MDIPVLKNENETKKIKEQKLVEESEIKLSNSNDNSTSISIIKIGKNKFISVNNKKITPVINAEKPKSPKKENKCYDLNDFDYDDYCDY